MDVMEQCLNPFLLEFRALSTHCNGSYCNTVLLLDKTGRPFGSVVWHVWGAGNAAPREGFILVGPCSGIPMPSGRKINPA